MKNIWFLGLIYHIRLWIVKSIGRKIRNFFARQYDALLHLDFQDKTNRTILRVVLINFAILFVVCLFWWYGTVAVVGF